MTVQWGHPVALWGLAALPLLAALGLGLLAARRRRLARLADETVWPVLMPERSEARLRARLFLTLGAAACGIVALARPQWGERWEEVHRRGLNILVALDTSNSMRAEDLKPSRLDRAKLGLQEFLPHVRGDRVGLITFAGTAFLDCPLTLDYGAFLMLLDDVHPGRLPRGGTDLGQALRLAVDKFEYQRDVDNVLVLVTDGEDLAGGAQAALDELRRKNIRVFAVGVGSPQGELIPDPAGRGFLKDRAGQAVQTRLDEAGLQKLALGTGGAYVRAAPGDFGLDRLYTEGILPLKRGQQESRMERRYDEQAGWFLAAALVLLAVETLPGERRRRRPSREGAA